MISFAFGRGNTHAQTGAPRHAVPTAVSPPPPDDAAIDAHRASDLKRLSDALALYRDSRGGYPTTRNAITQICSSETDAGCALRAVASDLAFSDGPEPYYYASDGARYVLMTRAKAAGDASSCPVGLPAELAAGAVICVSSGVAD